MADEERRLRTAFEGLILPAAPQSLHARLARTAANPPARSRVWPRASLVLAPALLVLILAALALSTGGLSPQQSRPPSAGALAHFDEGGLAFDYPATWREFHYAVDSSFSHVIAYLATVDVPVPCQTILRSDSTEIDCADRYSLAPDTLVVAVTSNGQPGFRISNHPDGVLPLTIGGLPGYLTVTKPSGDTLSLVWTLSRPDSVDNYYQIAATVRGPTADTLRAQLEALIASLQYDPPVTASLPAPATSPTELASSDPLPNPGGTCSASQIVVGSPTWGYGFGTLGTTAVYGTLPLRNIGGACVMQLPAVIGVAAATGPFHAVAVRNTGIATAWSSGSGESVPIMLGASWWIGGQSDNGTPLPAPPCNYPIYDVSRVEIPLATGTIAFDLPIVWHEVCSSPASVSITFETK
jgi:hypothetical protein